MARRKAPHIPDALLDQLLSGADPKSAFDADGLLDDLKKALAERALNAEMEHHLASAETGKDNGVASLIEAGRLKLEGWVEGAGGTAILGREEWLSHAELIAGRSIDPCITITASPSSRPCPGRGQPKF